MAFTSEFYRRVKNLIGSAADTDIATDIANITGQLEVAKMVSDTEDGSTYSDVVNITDKGMLTGVTQAISAFTAESSTHLKVVIDSVTVFDGTTIVFSELSRWLSFPFHHRFDTSLQIQHKMAADSKGTVRTFVTYTTD